MGNKGYALPTTLIVLLIIMLAMNSIISTQRKERHFIYQSISNLENRIDDHSILEQSILYFLESENLEELNIRLTEKKVSFSYNFGDSISLLEIFFESNFSNRISFHLQIEVITLENFYFIAVEEMSETTIIKNWVGDAITLVGAKDVEITDSSFRGLIVCEELNIKDSTIEGVVIAKRVNQQNTSWLSTQVFIVEDYEDFWIDSLSTENTTMIMNLLKSEYTWIKVKKIYEFK